MSQFLGRCFEIFVLSFILTVVLSHCARADSFMSFGLGISNSSNSRMFNLGYRDTAPLGLMQQGEVGFWADAAGGGRTSSAYAAYLLGVEVDHPAIVARFMAGPALITSPDTALGGPFQFTEELYLGLKGKNGNAIGIKYKHVSSAGIYQPNLGRDYPSLEVSIPW